MAGATDRQRTSAAVDLETVAFVASLLVFVGGAIALVAGIGTGVLLLVFGLGGITILRDAGVFDDAPGDEATRNETERDPLSVLRERYARGEIEEAEFERRLDRLLDTESIRSTRDRAERDRLEDRS